MPRPFTAQGNAATLHGVGAAVPSALWRFWRWVTRLGVHPGLPPTEAKYVILNNTLVLFMSGVAIAIIPVNYWSFGASDRMVALFFPLVQAPLFLVSLVFAARRSQSGTSAPCEPPAATL
ncbi:MAG: hypothetical protein FJ100_20940 [Deltaproteobacteria bacterium]|nr:hypothetical protein [Deltaproteobacteria bacterium]